MGKKKEFVKTENITNSSIMACQKKKFAFKTNMIFNSENIQVLLLTNFERRDDKDLF